MATSPGEIALVKENEVNETIWTQLLDYNFHLFEGNTLTNYFQWLSQYAMRVENRK